MILITGGNGQLGKATVNSLIEKGADKSKFVAMVRSEEKGQELKEKGVLLRIGDYDDYSSLLKAFEGVSKVLLISGSDIENRTKQHKNVVNAANEAGVKHILYTSIDRKTDSDDSPLKIVLNSHMATENMIKDSGLAYTILRNNLYLEMLPMYLGEKVLETGVYYPAGDGKVGFMLRSEMAEATANILLEDGHENKEYKLSGSAPVSFGEIAGMLSEITGRKVGYYSPGYQEYIDTLLKAGVPEIYVKMFAGFGEATRQGEMAHGQTDIIKLLGREPFSVKEFLKQNY